MKSLKTCAAVLAVVSMSSFAQAARRADRCDGASKCCECAPTSQPACCRPTIVKPCCPNVYTYQRQLSCLKPPCCDDGSGNRRGCRRRGCGNGCGNGACVNGACGNNGCVNGACGNGACGNGGACDIGGGCAPGKGYSGQSRRAARRANRGLGAGDCVDTCDPGCAAPGTACVNYDACCIAKLIYQSQTACYAKDRRAAIKKLAKYDCSCNPEIMSAFVYALNDADERVRAAAADAIGDQVRRNPCCCSPCVVNALTNALADCDKKVVKLAERALRCCGYDVVEPICETPCDTAGNNGACCHNGNGNACCHNGNVCAPVGAPVVAPEAAPAAEPAPAADEAPAPAEEPKAFYQKPAPQQVQARPASARRSLKNLFGLVN